MKSFHTSLRQGVLLLVLLCSLGAVAQTNRARHGDDQPSLLQSINEGDTIVERKFEGKIHDVVEDPPHFSGGYDALKKWMSENNQYSSAGSGVHSRVVLSFVVEPDGSISNIQVIRSVTPDFDKEAVRLVKAMPKWVPGRQNGEAVRVKYNMPVLFKLQ